MRFALACRRHYKFTDLVSVIDFVLQILYFNNCYNSPMNIERAFCLLQACIIYDSRFNLQSNFVNIRRDCKTIFSTSERL